MPSFCSAQLRYSASRAKAMGIFTCVGKLIAHLARPSARNHSINGTTTTDTAAM